MRVKHPGQRFRQMCLNMSPIDVSDASEISWKLVTSDLQLSVSGPAIFPEDTPCDQMSLYWDDNGASHCGIIWF